MPLISVITSVYNVERFVRQCLESVIAQTFRDWEFIVIDDGATDGSGAICDECAAADSRIKVIHKKNTGLSDSRNMGIEMASADIIGFVDSDDWIEPDMFEKMYHAITDTGADIAVCGLFKDYPGKSIAKCPVKKTAVLDRDSALSLILEDKIVFSFVWDKFYRKEVITEKMPSVMYEDYATLPKWFANAKKVVLCSTPLYHYRQRQGSIEHHVNPQRGLDFFNAELGRYRFITENGLLPERHDFFRNRVLRIGVKMAKEISRTGRSVEELLDYVEPIRSALYSCLPADRKYLKRRNRRRLRRLMEDPEKFIRLAIFTGKFKIEKHRRLF